MSSPSQSPSTAPVLQFFLETWFGQGLVLVAVPAVVGFIFRTWIAAHARDLFRLLRDVRITLQSTISIKVQNAVDAIQAELAEQAARERAESQAWAVPDPWLPEERSEEEIAADREERRLKGERQDQWVISTDRSVERSYVLQNVAARAARNVRLEPSPSGSFEVISGPPWDRLENGQVVNFEGRITNPETFSLFDRELSVKWTDDHGDEQHKRIQLDRDYSDRFL